MNQAAQVTAAPAIGDALILLPHARSCSVLDSTMPGSACYLDPVSDILFTVVTVDLNLPLPTLRVPGSFDYTEF